MKKTLLFGAMAALLLGTASCATDQEPAMAGDGTVQFTVELPGAIDSRAISDGTTAVKLDVACYDANGNYLDVEPTVKTDFVERVATVTYKLVKGQKYNFAFFAHAVNRSEQFPRVNIYNFEHGEKFEDCKFVLNGNRTVSDYANNEERDAFYGTLTDYVVAAGETTVTLTRPFAQLNLGTDDLAAAIAAGVEPRNVRISIPKVSKSFNIATGMASADDADTGLFYFYEKTGNDGAMPYKKDPAQETLTVDGKDYTWISMNYLLVPGNEANIDVDVTIHTTDLNTNEDGQDFNFSVSNVPVKKNHRTNIVGSMLTDDGNFKVVIDPIYDTPDYVVDANAVYYDVNENGALEDVIATINNDQPEKAIIRVADGVTVTWQTGASHGSTPLLTAENAKTKTLVIQGEGNSTFEAQGAGVGPIRVTNGGTLVFKNMNIVDNSVSYAEGSWEFSNLEMSGNLRFEGCTIKDGIALEGTTANNNTDLDAEFVGCNFVSNETTSSANPSPASMYMAWISGGRVSFTNCEFTGYRGVKIHEAYGSDVDAVYIDGCNFHDLSKKPGLAIGTVDATTTISIKNSQFVNCQPGDQGLYMYESDTNVSTFNFINENNTVSND